MSITKLVGNTTTTTTATRSKTPTADMTAVSGTTDEQQQQQQQQHHGATRSMAKQHSPLPPPTSQLQHTALLKIEPFVPSLNTRLRRPIGRSYSTLSRTPAHTTATTTTTTTTKVTTKNRLTDIERLAGVRHAPPVRHVRRQAARAVQRQRSKSTSSSSASNRPATTNAPTTAAVAATTKVESPQETAATATTTVASVQQQPNGICRIARLPREQEQLPDRINYDRRGLTAVPYFENEQNLRLLSLQHNLINVFHIPRPCDEQQQQQQQTQARGKSAATNGMSPPPPLAAPPPSSLVTTLPIAVSGTNVTGAGSGGGGGVTLKRGNLLQQKNLNFNPPVPANGAGVSSVAQLAPQYRFALKKSKSFMMHYTRHMQLGAAAAVLGGSKQRQPPPTPALNSLLMGTGRLQSFDSGGSALTSESTISTLLTATTTTTATTSEEEREREQDAEQQQLAIRNRQLELRAPYDNIYEHLVFLDLYDNQIERVANLDGLGSLSVLLLGKNRIVDLSGLGSLRRTLRVLDLHGNKISSIGNKLCCLSELKSLNLAGNQIRQINQNDLNGLSNLKELNLKRNRIRRINGFQHLVALERLWLCHNEVHKVEDMSSIGSAQQLLEVTVENNPVSLAGDCVSFLVSHLPRLQSLSQMTITEQVRAAAMAWHRNKTLSEVAASSQTYMPADVFNNIRREEVISNARTNWELLRSQQQIASAVAATATTTTATTAAGGGRRHATKGKLCGSNKQRELTKISESNEAIAVYEELQQLIKLPPIQQQQQQQQQQPDDALSGGSSAGSSLGPNVDSASSSCYSSDNEASPHHPPGASRRTNRKCRRGLSLGGDKKPQADNNGDGGAPPKSDEVIITSTATPPPPPTTTAPQAASSSSSPSSSSASASCTAVAADNATPDGNATVVAVAVQDAMHNATAATTITNHCQGGGVGAAGAGAGAGGAGAVVMLTRASTPNAQLASVTPIIIGGNTGYCLGPHYNNNSNNNNINNNNNNNGINALMLPVSPARTRLLSAQNSSNNKTITTTTTTTTTMCTTTPLACRRYMHGSLMRAQTIVGTVGVGNGNGKQHVASKLNGNLHTQPNTANATVINNNSGSNNNASTPSPPFAAASSSLSGAQSAVAANKQPTSNAQHNNHNNNFSAAATTNTAQLKLSATNMAGPTTTTAATAAAAAVAAAAATTAATATAAEREREQGGDYLIEICGRYLNVYGQGALRFIDKQWNAAKANDVHTLNFSYINFNSIATVLPRIKARFPHAEHFVFRETNISRLGELNALAELQGITSLFIDPEGNAITGKDLWRPYAIYRLSHWGLKLLNGRDVCDTETEQANATYMGLSDLVLWSMPDVMLKPLLSRLRLEESCNASKMSPKEWLMRADNRALRLVVGKEALQWKKPNIMMQPQQLLPQQLTVYGDLAYATHGQLSVVAGAGAGGGAAGGSNGVMPVALSTRERGKLHFELMLENTCNAVEKLHRLETLWPSLLLDIVRNAILDYSQLDTYLRNLMGKIMK